MPDLAGAAVIETLSVLSIGTADPHNQVRNVLLQRGHCQLSVAADSREILALPKQQRPEIAIIHDVASQHEIRSSSEHIRRTWPGAKILVICAAHLVPDDPLYDEWLAPNPSQEKLFATIEQLVASGRSGNQGVFGASINVRSNRVNGESRDSRGMGGHEWKREQNSIWR